VILLELAAQGIRGFAPAGGRATLRPGYNVVGADGAVLRRLLEALLYPGPKDAEALPRASGGPANAPVRAGLTVVGNDRITYRLVRDFAAGAQLQRFDPEKRAFSPVSQDLAEIAAFMQKTVGAPSPARLRALLALSAADLPSKHGGAGAALPAPARASLTPEQARKRIEALRGELEKAKVAEKLQAQIDELAHRQQELEGAFRGGAACRAEVEKAEAALAEHGPARDLLARLGDPDAKVALYEKATARRAEMEGKVAAEREALALEVASEPPEPFWKSQVFWACAAGGLVLLAGGIVGGLFRTEARYVSLLDVGGFGYAGWLALRWIGGEEAKDRLARRRKVVDDWERKVLAQYKRDTADVIDAVNELRGAPIPGATRTGVTNTSELREALTRAREALALVEEAKKKLHDWESSPEVEGAATEKAKVDEELRGLESKLAAEAGGFVRDVRSVEQELQRLQAEASNPQAAAPAAPAMPAAPARAPGDPLRTLVERAAIELSQSPAAAVRTVAQKASQTLSGVSFNRLGGLQADDRGNLQVTSGGRPLPAGSLAPADRDLLWIALRLAFLEQAIAAGKAFAVIEDAFGGLSDGSRRFAARLLKQIAKPGQIVHATTDPSFKEAADHAA
jgi:hypothetical protein